jgi:hypothetical protein
MRIDRLACVPLVECNGFEEAVQVFVYAIVMLDERVASARQICPDVWRIVPFEGRIVETELVVLVV